MSRAFVPVFVLIALLFSSLAFGLQPTATAQEATPAGTEECAATSPEENKALVTQFYEAIGSGSVAELMADDHVYYHPSGDETTEGGAAGWAGDRTEDFPDVSITVEPMVAEGDMVAAYVTWAGTHQDDDEEMGVPETGQAAEWVGVGFFRIECGKIAETWSVSDNLGRLMDLGVITEEELQSAESMATPAP